MEKTLVIMAAGIGSRYGGIKQLEPVGPSGEIIITYSIYDALSVGFDHIVIVLREAIQADFDRACGDRIAAMCQRSGARLTYVYQDPEDLPAGYHCPAERKKPWGTGQAVLAIRDVVSGPFGIINADDYYDKSALEKLYQYVAGQPAAGHYCLIGYRLAATLSAHGAVTRGVCQVGQDGQLLQITETKGITPETCLPGDTVVSMNLWGFAPDILARLQEGFATFLADVEGTEEALTREFLVPELVETLLQDGKATVQVYETDAQWFGVTYREDHGAVKAAFADLIVAGRFPAVIG